ncbi:triose-phosphate isomerase [Candidatus Peregrinibacteria bacterium]|nr:triose-phosphate isomerase [Candidatus Peregrinibacteria bacterium]
MSRRLLIAANWKMNPPPQGALQSGSPYFSSGDPEVVVFPTFIDLQNCIRSGQLIVGAQCGRPEQNGAFTGDVSIKLLKEFGCSYVLCGHSERRENHGETDEYVAEQVAAALEVGLHPIVCIGETWDDRKKKKEKSKVKYQLSVLPLESDVTIAYEPVWAISGGDPDKPAATAEDAQQMHSFIRSLLPKDRQGPTRILYGGSMKPENARELLSQEDIDGGLIGGASLDPKKFGEIVKIAEELGLKQQL